MAKRSNKPFIGETMNSPLKWTTFKRFFF